MGDRHVFSPSYMFETENDQRWNLTDHHYEHIERDAAESSSHTYPANNMSINEEQYISNHNHNHNPNSSPVSLPNNIQTPHYQQTTTGPENYENAPSSSNYNGPPAHENNSNRWNYKRKSPDNDNDIVGESSSDIGMPVDPWEESQHIDFLHAPWDYNNNMKPVQPVHGGENSARNVRSRVEVEPNDLSCEYNTDTNNRPVDVSSNNGSMREWDPNHTSSSVNGIQELNPFIVGTSNSTNNHPRDFQGTELQPVRGNRTNYFQRSSPNFRASSSSLQLGHTDEHLQLTTESYSSPHLRSTTTWNSSDPNARSRMSIERFRSFAEVANFRHRHRHASEGLMIMDHSAFGSRNPFDHHLGMRLDIDDMSYEELLALGERIGSVNTGLSDNMISKCLQESIYCSSDEIQEEGTCVICLEEYANMDDVGMLKGCKHDFHVGCIKKWLSMKNSCPICKSEPVKHN